MSEVLLVLWRGSLRVVERGLTAPTSHSLRSLTFQLPEIALGTEGAEL